ncbi:kinase C and casein kinase substrate in neurons protein 2 [Elysia marginata]|uniref:Kinase C and casein kinase substrate in neurons protein 2 n=1 Tax=Elysia marginata TaxID=1093978 RepID=A0AAV4GDT0_9GAST|nr:kinase C and casein kinase substrate in neurons protein 2 [Elysia marginata]
MSVNEDGIQSGSDSFWEVGKYMRTVKRVDNGFELCNHMKKLIAERAEIEKKYSAMLSEWAKKWNGFLDKGPEYGTTQGAWRGVLTEADHVADLHTEMAERLMLEVHATIKIWQKDNYHKSMMHFKETKEFEDNFRKAQKPWAKRLTKVVAAKKDYHAACRTEKSTANQENNARGDTTVSQDQLKKLQDKLRKCQSEVEGTREKYNAAVNDLNGYNAKYIEDMSEEYSPELQSISRRGKSNLSTGDGGIMITSIKHHSREGSYGSYTNEGSTEPPPPQPPQPQISYNSQLSENSYGAASSGGIADRTETPRTQKRDYDSSLNPFGDDDDEDEEEDEEDNTGKDKEIDTDYNPGSRDASFRVTASSQQDNRTSESVRASRTMASSNNTSCDSLNTTGQSTSDRYSPVPKPRNKLAGPSVPTDSTSHAGSIGVAQTSEHKDQADSPVNNGGENPFGDHDDHDDVGGEEPPSQGWVVRALYDYVKAEDDELEFKAGDIFTQTATEDEMGWCKGQKDGKVGFYPKNYVERI